METAIALNSRALKPMYAYLKERYHYDKKIPGTIFQNKEKLYVYTGELVDNLRINSIGLYFGEWRHNELRLSVEGAQIVGKYATSNIITLTKEQTKQWFLGEDIELEEEHGFFILKYEKEFIGCGKVKEQVLLNFLPKIRRVEIH